MRRPAPLVLAILLALAAVAAPAPAQSAAGDLLDLEFRGGTVAQFVAAIRTQAPDANIVVMPEAEDLAVPAVRLKRVDLVSALKFLDGIEGGEAGDSQRLSVASHHASRPDAQAIYTVTTRMQRMRQERPQTERSTVVSVGHVLDAGISAEDLLSAIETGLELLGEQEPARIRFHEATGLLLVRGHPEQVSVLQEVVAAIGSRIEAQAAEERRRLEVQAATMELERMHSDMAVTRQESQKLNVRLAEREAQIKVLAAQVDALQAALQDREEAIVRLQATVRDLQSKLPKD